MYKNRVWLFLLVFSFSSEAATVHGFVREKSSREPIIMANVWILGTHIGAATNMRGYYVLSGLAAGEYEICFRYLGYKTAIVKQRLNVDSDIAVDVELEEQPLQLAEMVITANQDQRENEIRPSQITVQTIELRRIPQVAEADLFRSMQMLPGVATLSDFSAGLYIRGGSPDQNLILLDQIDVYNPNHLFGFFSTFNTDAVKSVELLKGGFPANYGGRLSSVLNVYNKEGNRQEFSGVARLSLLSASSTIEGPWKKGSWMISGRRTYLDLAAKMAKIDLPYYFYDGHAKINLDLDENNVAGISLYLGNDLLDLDNDGTTINLNWGNKTFSSQWTHLFSSKLFSHFVLAGSQFSSDTKVKFDQVAFGLNNAISDLAVKGMLTYTPNSQHTVDFGFEAKSLHFKLDYYVVDSQYRNRFAGRYFSWYVQDAFKLSALNLLQGGLRLDHYSDGGYLRFDPRLSFQHLLSEKLRLTLSYGRYHQFLNQVQQEGFSFADMWFPVDHTFQPGQADHAIFGVTWDDKTKFSVSAEVYYKKYNHLAEYRTFRGGDEPLEHQTTAQNFYSGHGKSYGADIYVRNHLLGWEGWIGYSLAWTNKQVVGYNFGLEYFPTYDRRHSLTLIEDYRLSKKWRLSLAFKYGSGQPYTEATARYAVMDQAGHIHYEALAGKKNFYRLPAYHRLDVGLFFSTHLLTRPAELYLQAVNIYNHKNVWYRHYLVYRNPAEVKDYDQLPFLPTAGLSVYF